jgi:hypothetical protein
MTFEAHIRVVFDANSKTEAQLRASNMIEALSDAGALLATIIDPRPVRDHNIGEQVDS